MVHNPPPRSLKEAIQSGSTIRMFKSNWMEKLSHVHPATPFVIYIPVVLVALIFAFRQGDLSIAGVATSFAAGALIWTFAEYVIHRFVFHPPFSETYLKKMYFFVHGVHHDAPDDATRLMMPPSASIPLAILFYYIFQSTAGIYALPFFAGFVAAYMAYDFVHFATHFFNWKFAWFRKIKENHMRHHYLTQKFNFGLSSPLWDYVFLTIFKGKESLPQEKH